MSNYNNIGKIETLDYGNQIALKIELRQVADFEFQGCYQKAIVSLGQHTTMRGSGAPVIDRVSFEGRFAITTGFSNNQFVLNDAKQFLKEFDSVIGLTYKLYDELLERKAKARELEQKKADERKQKINDLNKFFND